MSTSSGKAVRGRNARLVYRTRYTCLREIRGYTNRAVYLRTVHHDRTATKPNPTTIPAHMDIHPFTESQSSAVLLTRWTIAWRARRKHPEPATAPKLRLENSAWPLAHWTTQLLPGTYPRVTQVWCGVGVRVGVVRYHTYPECYG